MNISFSAIGWFHLVCAILSMVTGVVVILNKKGTKFHKKLGYVYVACMLLLNFSSFFIVNFKGFSIFHFFAIISLISIFTGMFAAIKRYKNWLYQHYYFMAWSVVGLYCAFWAEIGTRFVKNMHQFWWAVAIATFVTAFLGALIINKEAKKLFKK